MSTSSQERTDASSQITDGDLCYLSANDALAMFRRRELSPVELMRAVIERCETVNPKVNALTYTYFDRALDEAKAAEARYANSGSDVRPLEGIPLAIKDLHPVKGEITTWGSKVFEGVRADYSLPIVERLLDAGAILHCRTTSPEFAHTGHCHSPLWGATRNPWNLDYSSGGSSGGSGVAVATGMTTLADGDDGGGSIRIPASANGVFGFKPPFGRNPGALLPTNYEWIIHLGPITRTVDDAILMQNVMSGPHPADIATVRPKINVPLEGGGDLRGKKIAFSMDLGYFTVASDVQANTHKALEAFRGAGAEVVEVDLGWDMSAYEAWMEEWAGLFAAIAEQHLPRFRYELDPYVRKLLEYGRTLRFTEVKRLEAVRVEMYKKLSPILTDNDFVVCPTLATPSVDAWHKPDDPDFTIDGKPVDAMMQWTMTYPFNLLSPLPVASVPSGFGNSGVPTGVQIVGRTYEDASVLHAAQAYERVNPWGHVRPPV